MSEFAAPPGVSLGLLAAAGISSDLAPFLLHAASLLDCVLGLVTLLGIFTRTAALAQAAVIVAYTLLLVGHVPELWTHPFAPIGKNMTLLAAALALAVAGGGRWSLDCRRGRGAENKAEPTSPPAPPAPPRTH